jgi:DNA (cytosine-5)-methyltransferase 1
VDQRTINNLSLCTGGAGLDLGLGLALGNVRTICRVEHEAAAIEILAEAMESGCLDEAPLWTDLQSFDGCLWSGLVDTLTAGYPCQPFSKAGRRRGQRDQRHLWPHVRRIIGEAEPGIVFLENVSDHLSLGLREVVRELEEMGFGVAAGLYSAEEVGASQERERLFILAVAHTMRPRLPDAQQPSLTGQAEQELFARAPTEQLRRPLFPPGPGDAGGWRRILEEDKSLIPAQSQVRLLADGLARDRAHWIRLLGNGVVPLQAAYAFCSLWTALRYRVTA